MESHLYRDVIAVCSADGSCYVRNDNALGGFSGALQTSLLRFSSGGETALATMPLNLPRGGAAFQYVCAAGAGGGGADPLNGTCPPLHSVLQGAGCDPSGRDCALIARAVDAGGLAVDENFQLLSPPYKLALPPANVTSKVDGTSPRPSDGAVPITISADAFALYAWLSTEAQGRFETNFLPLPPGSRIVWFIPFPGFDAGELQRTLRVEHVQAGLGVNRV
jgi:hypothetical protein